MFVSKKRLLAVLLPGFLLLLVLARSGGPGPYDVRLIAPERLEKVYDLVVVGSDPEGIAAAVSGARNGLAVLLVDSRPELGGLMTRGWLNSLDMNYGPDGEILNEGIFLEFFKQIGGDSFDVREAGWVFNRLAAEEENLQVLLGVAGIRPVTTAQNGIIEVKGVRFTASGQGLTVTAPVVIDATQDGDIAALAGVPHTVGQEDIGRKSVSMAVTRVFRLEGVNLVDWFRMVYYLKIQDGKRSSGANWHSAWGFSEITAGYRPADERVALRGLNIGRQNDGSVLVNALLVFGTDPLDRSSLQEARNVAAAELPLVVEFLRKNVPGLGGARLAGAAPELYVRESRHIVAEYRLTIDDVLENRDFEDRIAFGSYPVDIQPSGPGTPGVIIGKPAQYAVPFRCLVPRGVDGLLVVGRAAGYDTLAHGSARTIPVGMAVGQAAGAAAALALENGLSFRRLSADAALLNELQHRLNQQGMKLRPFSIENPLSSHRAYEGLKFVRGLGMASGGYGNDYRLDEPIEHRRFINILGRTVRQCGLAVPEQPVLYPEDNIFNIYDASYALSEYLGLNLGKDESFAYLKDAGLFQRDDDYWSGYTSRDIPLSHGAAYMIIRDFALFVEANSG